MLRLINNKVRLTLQFNKLQIPPFYCNKHLKNEFMLHIHIIYLKKYHQTNLPF
jgi:hypothetical protein